MTIEEVMTITETELKIKWNEGLEIFQVSLRDYVGVGHGYGIETIENKGSGILTGTWGGGKTKKQAILNYCSRIEGLILVKDGMDRYKRREYPMPDRITCPKIPAN